MPITPSHAVVALPFVRGPLVPGAIAIGAMAPDLPLFVRASPISYDMTHEWRWLALTLLVSWLLYALWRAVVLPAVGDFVPVSIAERLPADAQASMGERMRVVFPRGAVGILSLLVSLAIGVASHIAWDELTHEGRWGQQAFPGLGDMWGPLPGYTWLQYGSSAFGAIVLIVWGISWLRQQQPRKIRRVLPRVLSTAWLVLLPCALAIAAAAALAAEGGLTAQFTRTHVVYFVLVPVAAVWAVGTLALCAVAATLHERSRQRQLGGSAPHGRGGGYRSGAPS